MTVSDVSKRKSISVGIHDGIFHADEVFAVVLLELIYTTIGISRTRDEERLKNVDMRVDVGGKYNPDTLDFDHHQAGFNERHESPNKFRYDEGPLRSGFGLVFKHFGKKAIKKLYPDITDTEIDDIYKLLDRDFVAAIDCSDNGENDKFRSKEFPYSNNNISKFISLLNDTTNNDPNSQMSAFYTARNIASMILKKEIENTAFKVLSCSKFDRLAKEMGDNEILILDEYLPYAYCYNKSPYANKIEMIVFPNLTGTWMCATPKYYYYKDKDTYPATLKDGKPREYKHQAPLKICGARDKDLARLTGVDDALFVHANGHLGACKTKDGAIMLAKYFIDHGRS